MLHFITWYNLAIEYDLLLLTLLLFDEVFKLTPTENKGSIQDQREATFGQSSLFTSMRLSRDQLTMCYALERGLHD